jgi:hypothetical protein
MVGDGSGKIDRPKTAARSRRGARAADTGSQTPQQNHLLEALPPDDFDRLQAHLELIPMQLGDVLYEPGIKLRHVYFPTTSIVSLLYVMEDGASAEIAIVGNERVPIEGRSAAGRISTVWFDDASIVALHAGADHADGADGGVQSPSFGRSAAVPLVAAEP